MKKKLIGKFTSKKHIVDLGKIYVINDAIINEVKVTEVYYSLDNVKYFKTKTIIKENNFSFNNLVARYIKLDYDFEIKIYQGVGYIGKANKKWDKLFICDNYWVGGDGLFSFNLTGKDNYNAKENDRTLCVFGDTFACTLAKDTRRLSPLAMPNNSYCEFDSLNPKKDEIQFHVNEDEKGHCKAFLEVENELGYSGTMASNLVNYNPENYYNNYLSGLNPKKDIEIEFDLLDEEHIQFIEVFNYFVPSKIDYLYQNRGIKDVDIYIDNKFFKKQTIKKASFNNQGLNSTKILIDQKCKNIKFVVCNINGIGNYKGANLKENFFGLNKVYFYRKDKTFLENVKATANSEFLKKSKHSYLWMQDGVVLNNKLYSLPFVVSNDETAPEGFKFKIEGICLLEVEIEKGKINFSKSKQIETNLYRKTEYVTYNFGAGFYNNSFNSLERKSDGYIYIYGYKSDKRHFELGNQLIVARVKEEEFTSLNKWKYFNGKKFVSNLLELASLVSNVSCELSVSFDSGKYILVYTRDVQSRYIAYAQAKTPYGSFEESRIAYVCPENLCKHMYLYNAKAHPHLSKQGDLLASYNINTSNFDENIAFGRVYGPRFISLKRIGGR